MTAPADSGGQDLFPITQADMLTELDREIALRHRVYPRWIAAGKLKSDKAERQIAVLQAVRELIGRWYQNEGRHTLPGAAPDKPLRDHWARKVLP